MNKSRVYNTVCVFIPDAQGDKLNKLEEKINKILNSHKVEDMSRKDWGVRKLAYPINRSKSGHYIEYVYKAPATAVMELERNLGYEEAVLRYLTIKDTKHTPKNVQVEMGGFEFIE